MLLKRVEPSLLKQNQCCLVVFDVVYVSIVRSRFVSKQEKFYPRCTPRLTGPQSRDTPPKRGYLLLFFRVLALLLVNVKPMPGFN